MLFSVAQLNSLQKRERRTNIPGFPPIIRIRGFRIRGCISQNIDNIVPGGGCETIPYTRDFILNQKSITATLMIRGNHCSLRGVSSILR